MIHFAPHYIALGQRAVYGWYSERQWGARSDDQGEVAVLAGVAEPPTPLTRNVRA